MRSESFTKEPRQLRFFDAVALTVGSMVGAGIFAILALTVKTAGPAAVISWVLVVVFSLPMAYTFSDLTGILSQSGGPYVYLRKRTSHFVSAVVAWSFLLSALGASEALLMALKGMMAQTGIGGASVLTAVVVFALSVIAARGIHVGANVQRALTVATVALLFVCVGIGIAHARWLPGLPIWPHTSGQASGLSSSLQRHGQAALSTLHTVFPHGFAAVLPAAFFAFWTYSGWEAVTVPSGAYASRDELGRGMLVGSFLVGGLYIMVAIAAVVALPTQVIAGRVNPLAVLAGLWGPVWSTLVSYGAMLITIGSLMSWLIASATLLQALFRDGLLPGAKQLRSYAGEYHPAIVYGVFVLLVVCSWFPIFSAAIAASSLTALFAYAAVFAAVFTDKNANWPGLIRSRPRRRITAAFAFLVAVALILFSGWNNIWPTLLMIAAGGVLFGRGTGFTRRSNGRRRSKEEVS
ncbi:APC family permease [Alicyclobacillus tolerans]|uniref:APC family permease n=1 Tax=Alicyclobacillus tolerans TaxID=90970 RepID=UPI001F386CA1|nr:APC family permease [Alicyclobacillus tolerans]MCF8564064.1 APC family permease [Alicyclobacillus tolerans]